MSHPNNQKKNKRALPILGFTVRRISDYQNITEAKKTKMFVFISLLNAVRDGIDSNVDQVGLIKIKGSNASIALNKADWKGSLDKAMEFFTSHEYYESCQKCKELIDELNETI